ncbi:MAG: hypothetical protein HWE13_04950 [Gammaproteobacteria bacterium]|nr:hypothetical protein [Gammaproteobacteria bacterium]NVK87448.1 hypothetical protein [Gammaproteobacteria bacterium]
MNSKTNRVKSIAKASGAFLFRRNRRGPAEQLTNAAARLSRSKISDK